MLPELPEVETIRRQLEPHLRGQTIAGVNVPDPHVTAPASPAVFGRQLKGKRIAAVTRRGKYLRLELRGGETFVIHLRMTGRLTYVQEPVRLSQWPHLRLVITFISGAQLLFQDQRRFGTAFVIKPGKAEAYWRRLGPEPLERAFNARALAGILDGRKRPVKSLLLDQHLIAGIGNIYADEALYRARIHPLRRSGDLTPDETGRLSRAVKETLRDAIRLEGSSIDTYRDARGRRGRFQETFKVHRRSGEPCPACGGMIEKLKVGGRGTYFCPGCQKI